MMEFYAVEYMDGDIGVFGHDQDDPNSAWHKVGMIKFGEQRQVQGMARRLGLTNLNSIELERLDNAVNSPTRW